MQIIRKENNYRFYIILIWLLGFFLIPLCLYNEKSADFIIKLFDKSTRSKLDSFKQYSKLIDRSQKMISGPKEEIIFIVGSSDLRDSFHTQKVEDELKNYSLYNLTSSSQTLVESKLLITKLISREVKPRKIILGLNDWRITSPKNYGLIGNKIIHHSYIIWNSRFFNWNEKITSPISNTAIFTKFYYDSFRDYIKGIGRKSLPNKLNLSAGQTLDEKIKQSCMENKLVKNNFYKSKYNENIQILDQIFSIAEEIDSELVLLTLPSISCTGKIKSSLDLTRKELLKKNYELISLTNNIEENQISINSFKDFKHFTKEFSEKLIGNYIRLIR